MNEEAVADSPSESPESTFDMEAAQESIASDIWGKSEPVVEESVEETVEEVDLSQEKPVEKEEKVESVEKDEVPEAPKRKAPQSWKKEMHEFYNSADPALQDYIERREEQMHEGLQKDRNDANLGRTMRDMLAPHEEGLRQRGIEGPQAVKYLLNAHNALSNGTPEQKQAAIIQLAQSYGVTKPDEKANPEISSLKQEIYQIKQYQNDSQQRALQAARAKIDSEVSAFADKHPLFDDLQEEMAKFIEVGSDLEDAYEKALWANPLTRQTEIERLETEKAAKAEKDAKKEIEQAKKARSINVKGRDTGKAPTAPKGTMEDTMRETYREIQNRN